MGKINPSKMPQKKIIERTDDPEKVAMYKSGGRVKKFDNGGLTDDNSSDLVEKVKQMTGQANQSSDPSIPNPSYSATGESLIGRMPIDMTNVRDSVMASPKYVQLGKDSQSVGARLNGVKKIDNDSMLQAYVDADIMRNKQQGMKGKASGVGFNFIKTFSEGGKTTEVWDKPRPKGLGKPKALTASKKSKAKAMAKSAGRPYPNLVDNMRAARSK
jgi:hypothetical protein